jgi:hypothetical protein
MDTHNDEKCMSVDDFKKRGKHIREQAIEDEFDDKDFPDPENNGEEKEYHDPGHDGKLNYIANYTRGLPHHSDPADPKYGEVDQDAYKKLLKAICTGKPSDFQTIPLGDTSPCKRKLTNPQSAFVFDLEGPDSRSLRIPIEIIPHYYLKGAPRIDGEEAAGEMAELYWMALCRDVSFSKFSTNSLIGEAVDDLKSNYSKFPIPPYPGGLNRDTIFRGFLPGDLEGPFISQFLLLGTNDAMFVKADGSTRKFLEGYIKYGSISIDQRQETVKGGKENDYVYGGFDEWLKNQNGFDPRGQVVNGACMYDPTCKLVPLPAAGDGRGRFIRNLRDLSNYVHYDDLPQEFLNACLILKHFGIPPKGHDQPCAPQPHGPVDKGNPYLEPNPDAINQEAIATFGDQYVLTMVAEVARRALYAAWYQKWFVHRRLRPEEFGGLIQSKKTDSGVKYPINKEILDSIVLQKIKDEYGSYLLPQAYPEGCAMHPSYPSGHATIAGACVTVLKAYFD